MQKFKTDGVAKLHSHPMQCGSHWVVVEVKLETKLKHMERAQGNDLDTVIKQGHR